MKKMVRDAVAILFNIEYSVLYIYEDNYLMKFKEENEVLVKEKHKKIKNIKTYLLNKYTTIKIDNDYYIPLAVKNNLVGVIEIAASERVNTMDKNITKVFLVQLSIIIKNKIMEFETRKKSFNIIRSLSEAIEAKDIYTRGHSERVMKYGIKIAEKMNLDEEYIEKIKYAGILHDVGKIGIPENILQKNGGLTEEEYAIIKTHPEKGAKILSHMSSLKEITEIVRYHHERIDGKGYPEGLEGDKIPLGARILAIADTFDAMTSDRPYRKGLPLEIVKSEILTNKNKQFDGEIAELLIEMLEKKEIEVEKY
jgi:putative nucleotidyltransferase with HDIG domain